MWTNCLGFDRGGNWSDMESSAGSLDKVPCYKLKDTSISVNNQFLMTVLLAEERDKLTTV